MVKLVLSRNDLDEKEIKQPQGFGAIHPKNHAAGLDETIRARVDG